MNARTQEAIDRLAQDSRPLPTDDVMHACRGELEHALKRLDAQADMGGDVPLQEAERIIIEACCDGYELGHHEEAMTSLEITRAWKTWQVVLLVVLAWACFGAGVLWHWLHFR
jgi:hypothetical protein